MSLKHVIMVVINNGECSGYEISKQFEGPLGQFWNTSHQRIYRALATLYQAGWVDFKPVIQQGRPDKKVYRLTTLGEEKLDTWLCTPQKPTAVNSSFLVKLYSGKHAPIKPLLAELQAEYAESVIRLEVFNQQQQEHFPQADELDQEACLQYLILLRVIKHTEASLQWTEVAMDKLQSIVNSNKSQRSISKLAKA